MHKALSPLQFEKEDIHETRYTMKLDPDDVERACREYAARMAGLDPNSEYVSAGVTFYTKDVADGPVEAVIVLTDRHLNKPRDASA